MTVYLHAHKHPLLLAFLRASRCSGESAGRCSMEAALVDLVLQILKLGRCMYWSHAGEHPCKVCRLVLV